METDGTVHELCYSGPRAYSGQRPHEYLGLAPRTDR